MTFFLHLRRNIFRNRGRSMGVVAAVALAIGIFLILGSVSSSIVAYSNDVVNSVPNILVVQPQGGSLGAGGNVIVAPGSPGYATLTASVISQISATPDVRSVQRMSISSAALGGTGGAPGKSGCANGNSILAEDTTSTVKIVGANQVSGAATPIITSGRTLNASDEDSTNVLVGQQYASDNNLAVGSQLSMYGQEFTVVGIYSGSGCDGDTVVVPYPTAAKVLNIADPIFVYAYVNSYSNVGGVYSALGSKLGPSYSVEDLSTADHNALQDAISSILTSSEIGEYAALAVGVAVVVVIMLLVTSRRTKEVGILKVLGYGNARILGLILVEALALSLLGLPLAIGFVLLFGPLIAQVLLGGIGNTSPYANNPPPSGAHASNVTAGASNPFLQNVHFALTTSTIYLGIEITVAIGLIAALLPAVDALRLRPAEALRHE